MKIRKETLIFFLPLVSSLSIAQIVLCPSQVTCSSSSYSSCVPNTNSGAWYPINGYYIQPNTSYSFMSAAGMMIANGDATCSYGTTMSSVMLVSKNAYYPDLNAANSLWVQNGNSPAALCPEYYNPQLPPQDCPFTTTSDVKRSR